MSNKSAMETLCARIERDAPSLNWTQPRPGAHEASWNGLLLFVGEVARLGKLMLPNRRELWDLAEEAAAAAILRSCPDGVEDELRIDLLRMNPCEVARMLSRNAEDAVALRAWDAICADLAGEAKELPWDVDKHWSAYWSTWRGGGYRSTWRGASVRLAYGVGGVEGVTVDNQTLIALWDAATKQHPPKHVVTLRDDAAPWLHNMVELANGGANIVVNLDNDNQYAYDETGWSWDDADDDEAPPEFEGLRDIGPRELIVELFAALGIKAQSV